MGFFDRVTVKKEGGGAPTNDLSAGAAGGVLPQLVSARERLEAKDLAGALGLYEQVLATAGDRADVLVTISGDLGVNGHVREIVELVAPRYDAERHGPATGLNLLQAYLVLRQAEAAQHVLDILFALQRPELEERLFGFSNAIAELIQNDLPPLEPAGPATGTEVPSVNFVSISKPIWFYGLEPLAAQILPEKGSRLRRIAFPQLALLGVKDLGDVMKQPETAIGRLTRALPLWLAETFYFSPHYSSIAVVGVMNQKHYALLGTEWTTENLRQLNETTEGGLDYIFTGALRPSDDACELVLRLWEVKKLKERKTFITRWTADTADAELAKLHQQVCTFMEWTPEKTGASYSVPARPTGWLDLLGSALSFFLGDKGLLPREQLVLPATVIEAAASFAPESDIGSLAWLSLMQAAKRNALVENPEDAPLRSSAVVESARQLFS